MADPAALIRDAERQCGLPIPIDPTFLDGLTEFSAALTIDATTQITHNLMQRARLCADRTPEIAATPVSRPIVIAGLPRSGTTFLHRLLAESPGRRYIRTWQALDLSPPPPVAARRRIAAAGRQLAGLPAEFSTVRPVDPYSPEECNAVTALAFQSADLFTVYDVPGYAEWYLQADHGPAYVLHRHVLQHLAAFTEGDRWVLKSPSHLFHLPELFREYPDARLVYIERDSADAMASLVRMVAMYRGYVYGRASDPTRELESLWGEALRRARPFIADPRTIRVSFAELVADPVGVVAGINCRLD